MQFDRSDRIAEYMAIGKTIASIESVSPFQSIVIFTDGTYMTFTARVSEGKPWMTTGANAHARDQEWDKEEN